MQRLVRLQFEDRPRVEREIAEIARNLPFSSVNRLDLLLTASPSPEQGLHYFIRLRERQPASFDRLTRSHAGLRYLIAIFTHSHFLAEDILEHPEWVEGLLD